MPGPLTVRSVFQDLRNFRRIPQKEINTQLLAIDHQNTAQTQKAMQALRGYIETDILKFQVGAALQSAGNLMVDHARKKHAFGNITGRLERSIAWVFSDPFTIVFYAGMHYAPYVEAKGFWVLSGTIEMLRAKKERLNWQIKRAMQAARGIVKIAYQ